MRRAPALNIPLSRVPERQGAPRSVLPPLGTVAEADYSSFGGGGQANSARLGNLAALAGWRSSGRFHFPALLIDRHAHDIVDGRRRLGLLRRAEAQVIENLLDGDGVVEVGHDLELPPALATRERVGMEDLRDEARQRSRYSGASWLAPLRPWPLPAPPRRDLRARDWHSSRKRACDVSPGPGCDPPFSPAIPTDASFRSSVPDSDCA